MKIEDPNNEYSVRKSATILEALRHFMSPAYRDRDWFPSEKFLTDEELIELMKELASGTNHGSFRTDSWAARNSGGGGGGW